MLKSEVVVLNDCTNLCFYRMHLWKFAIFVSTLALSGAIKVEILEKPAGIYYKPVREISFTEGKWRAIGSIELADIKFTQPYSTNQKEEYYRDCIARLGRSECPLNTRMEMLNHLDDRIRRKKEAIVQFATDLEPTNYEMIQYADEIDAFQQRTGNSIRYRHVNLFLIKNKIMDINEELKHNYYEPQNYANQELIQARNRPNVTKEELEAKYNDWILKVAHYRMKNEEILDKVQGILDQLVQEKLPPGYTSFTELIRAWEAEEVAEDVERLNEYYIRGIMKRVQIEMFLDVTVKDTRIIVSFQFPSIHMNKFFVYRLHGYPIYRQGNKSAVIQLRKEFLILSEDKEWYALVGNEELSSCGGDRDYQICTMTYPLRNVATATECEVKIMMQAEERILEDCLIIQNSNQELYLKGLTTENKWLYSSRGKEEIEITKDSKKDKKIIYGVGILGVEEGYQLKIGGKYLLIGAKAEKQDMVPRVEINEEYAAKYGDNLMSIGFKGEQVVDMVALEEMMIETRGRAWEIKEIERQYYAYGTLITWVNSTICAIILLCFIVGTVYGRRLSRLSKRESTDDIVGSETTTIGEEASPGKTVKFSGYCQTLPKKGSSGHIILNRLADISEN